MLGKSLFNTARILRSGRAKAVVVFEAVAVECAVGVEEVALAVIADGGGASGVGTAGVGGDEGEGFVGLVVVVLQQGMRASSWPVLLRAENSGPMERQERPPSVEISMLAMKSLCLAEAACAEPSARESETSWPGSPLTEKTA